LASGSITVVDHRSRFVGRILSQKRYWVSLDRIPQFLQKALVGIEDARFYEHGGIDLRGIARALMKDVIKGRLAEGGSTITQQLIKNKFLTAEVSLDRKVKEARMAMEFEKKYSKQQILEMYFNEIYYGNGVWGLPQAARFYFDKRPDELSEVECVLLAGLPKNPGRYNPLGKPADVNARRDTVLNRLVELRIISAKQQAAIRAQRPALRGPGSAPQYLAEIRNRLVERFGADAVEQGGMEVTAALDLDLQKQAEAALRAGVGRLAPGLQGALVCLDPATGDVLAAVGGTESNQGSLNRAFVSRRQPGSAIKPLIYAAALEQGITANSVWDDTPEAYDRGNGETWKPRNYKRERFGQQSLRQALAYSNNVITVKLLQTVGVPRFVEYAARMGLSLHAQNGLSLALGTEEVTLEDLVQAYTPLATGGSRVQARTIQRIHDLRRDTWTDIAPVLTPSMDPGAAYITTQMMKDVMTYGTAKGIKGFLKERPAAGKTGTTDEQVDAWFVGFTPKLITGVWVGYDQPKGAAGGITGASAAAPIWDRFMRKATAQDPPDDFPRPEGVVPMILDPDSGGLATDQCPKRQEELFIRGTEPMALCPRHPGAPLPENQPQAEPPVQAAPDAAVPLDPEPPLQH
jgi:1A family penicillin-binding protein